MLRTLHLESSCWVPFKLLLATRMLICVVENEIFFPVLKYSLHYFNSPKSKNEK